MLHEASDCIINVRNGNSSPVPLPKDSGYADSLLFCMRIRPLGAVDPKLTTSWHTSMLHEASDCIINVRNGNSGDWIADYMASALR
jgi:hypothetical protein